MPKLQTNGAKQKQTTYMILLLWAAVCFALLVVDGCCWAPNRLDADMASEQLLANLLAQEGGVMSTNWYYSTELRVLNTQLVMVPLFRLFTSWHTVRVVGSVVLILLYLAAWFWFGHSAKLKYSGLLGAGLLVLPYGALYRQYVLEGLYYIFRTLPSALWCWGVRCAFCAAGGGWPRRRAWCCSALLQRWAGRGSCSS